MRRQEARSAAQHRRHEASQLDVRRPSRLPITPVGDPTAARTRRSSEDVAREAVDAIRLALAAADTDRAAVAVIRMILADGPPVRRDDTGSVRRLLRAIKRTPKARLKVA